MTVAPDFEDDLDRACELIRGFFPMLWRKAGRFIICGGIASVLFAGSRAFGFF